MQRAGWLKANWSLAMLLAVCIARLWLVPLPSIFRTGEFGTAFIVERPEDVSLAVVPQLPASIYYLFPRVAVKLLGASEITDRLPSILLMAIALFFVAPLANRLIHPAAGWFALFACLALADLDYYAADARPYALGICLACGAMYSLVNGSLTAGLPRPPKSPTRR